MKDLRRFIFISSLPVIALMLIFYSSIKAASEPAFLGVFISAMTVLFFFVGLFIIPRPRTGKYLWPYTGVIILGFLTSFFFGLYSTEIDFSGMIIGLFLFVYWIFYLKWFSFFDKRFNEHLVVGQKLPVFHLQNIKGENVNASNFIGKPTIYIFYRGNWCPFCMSQIKEVAKKYKQIEAYGANTVLISPQPHKYTTAMARKFRVGFHFLIDKGNLVAKQLGIDAKTGIPSRFQFFGFESDTVMPTVIITDSQGKIVFADLTDSYRIRPKPSTFLQILEETQKTERKRHIP